MAGSTYQVLHAPNNRTYIGSGKVTEVARAVRALNAETVIFDDELSPGQVRGATWCRGHESMSLSPPYLDLLLCSRALFFSHPLSQCRNGRTLSFFLSSPPPPVSMAPVGSLPLLFNWSPSPLTPPLHAARYATWTRPSTVARRAPCRSRCATALPSSSTSSPRGRRPGRGSCRWVVAASLCAQPDQCLACSLSRGIGHACRENSRGVCCTAGVCVAAALPCVRCPAQLLP